MYKEISSREGQETADTMTGFIFCIQGAIENAGMNGQLLNEWDDGAHIADTYLADNEPLKPEQMGEISAKIQEFINKNGDKDYHELLEVYAGL